MKKKVILAALFATTLGGLALVLPELPFTPVAIAGPKLNKEQKARKLLTLTGADAMGKQMIDSMMTEFAKMPDLPPGFAQKFKELAMKEDLVTMIVPVYVKYLDEKDLDGAIAFYESKSGQNLTKAQPQILTESMSIGQKWGADLAQRAMADLEKSKAPAPAATPKK